MQQHLQRLDGVAKAEVSLRDGHVTVYPKQGAALDPSRILKATYDSGVSVAEMEITASGTIELAGGARSFRVNSQQSYALTPNSLSEKLESPAGNRKVTVRGRLYQKPPGTGRPKGPPAELKLEILEVKDAP